MWTWQSTLQGLSALRSSPRRARQKAWNCLNGIPKPKYNGRRSSGSPDTGRFVDIIRPTFATLHERCLDSSGSHTMRASLQGKPRGAHLLSQHLLLPRKLHQPLQPLLLRAAELSAGIPGILQQKAILIEQKNCLLREISIPQALAYHRRGPRPQPI